jgi:hypothetical protein
MRRIGLLTTIGCVLCAVLAGCDGGAPATPPATADGGGSGGGGAGGPGDSSGSGVGEPAPTEETDLPGVPGSPIDYDNTLFLAGPDGAKAGIERELGEKCGPDRCGVTVVIEQRGEGNCVTEISPRPVDPGGTVTVYVGPGQCEEQPEETEPPTDPTTG